MSQHFIPRNEGFFCSECGAWNPPAPKTCRNHCRKCFASQHLDHFPGDRAANCGGVMWPVSYRYQNGSVAKITFRCEQCGATHENKPAEDDCLSQLEDCLRG